MDVSALRLLSTCPRRVIAVSGAHTRSCVFPLPSLFTLAITKITMRIPLLSFVLIGALSSTTKADCRHPNGNIQTDPYHAPCADVLDNPLNNMCCAIERPNPSEGFSKDGLSADVCLSNGLCKQSWRQDENSSVTTHYYREECTFTDWKSGKCLSVCLSNSVRRGSIRVSDRLR